ncbi:MAG: DUF6401 family natural product biosynthesis protein [Streptosporangiales bacterium]|jgi:hypothetical protein|nr:DUF6401 family natural product biosynthesis protein [Streptosporangiales bacterium]
MPLSDQICTDLRDMVLRLAGEAGQASLARSGDSPGLRAEVDQQAAEIRNSLTGPGRPLTPDALLSYARGFTEAAIGRGWRHAPDDPEPAWESLRLAAVCRLLLEAEGLPV